MASGAIDIGIFGCTGRVGRLLTAELLSGRWPGLRLAGGTVRGGADRPEGFFVTEDPAALIARSHAVVDFTAPEGAAAHIALAARAGIPAVAGTTGLNAEQERALREAARAIPVVYAANTSVGVTILAALVEQAAARLGPEWDIEILETHHRHKADAPSGTAIMLGRAAAAGRKTELDAEAVWTRQGHTGARTEGAIGFAVRRGGDVAGEHAAGFYGEGERIELSHVATDRALFARGALRAAQWAVSRPPGLYTMRDVIGL